MNNHSNQKGYYVYSTITIIVFVALFGFIGYLLYDIVVKAGTNKFSNMTLVQSIATLIGTVFIGGYFSKSLEYKNNRRMEEYKTQKEIALRIIDLAGLIIRNEEISKATDLLINENLKVKLFFDDKAVNYVNAFITNKDPDNYNNLIEHLKTYFK